MALPVKRLKYSMYNGVDGGLPAIHIGVVPDPDSVQSLLIHVQAYQMADLEETIHMIEAVMDTLREFEIVPADPSQPPERIPFNPQPR